MRTFVGTLALLASVVVASAGAQAPDTTSRQDWIRTVSGLEYRIVSEGRGRQARGGDTVTVHEALSLPGGRVIFDSRVAPNNAVTFTLGANQVIRGVDEGVTGMRVGERRQLRVPPALDGRTFDPAFIPADAIRLYDITLLAAKP